MRALVSVLCPLQLTATGSALVYGRPGTEDGMPSRCLNTAALLWAQRRGEAAGVVGRRTTAVRNTAAHGSVAAAAGPRGAGAWRSCSCNSGGCGLCSGFAAARKPAGAGWAAGGGGSCRWWGPPPSPLPPRCGLPVALGATEDVLFLECQIVRYTCSHFRNTARFRNEQLVCVQFRVYRVVCLCGLGALLCSYRTAVLSSLLALLLGCALLLIVVERCIRFRLQ